MFRSCSVCHGARPEEAGVHRCAGTLVAVRLEVAVDAQGDGRVSVAEGRVIEPAPRRRDARTRSPACGGAMIGTVEDELTPVEA